MNVKFIFLPDETTEGGYICPAGYHCPKGTPAPLRCSPGGYSDQEMLEECKPCRPGYYCPANSTDSTSFPCEPGYFCPEGTLNLTERSIKVY